MKNYNLKVNIEILNFGSADTQAIAATHDHAWPHHPCFIATSIGVNCMDFAANTHYDITITRLTISRSARPDADQIQPSPARPDADQVQSSLAQLDADQIRSKLSISRLARHRTDLIQANHLNQTPTKIK